MGVRGVGGVGQDLPCQILKLMIRFLVCKQHSTGTGIGGIKTESPEANITYMAI